jgi:hypothetical protein
LITLFDFGQFYSQVRQLMVTFNLSQRIIILIGPFLKPSLGWLNYFRMASIHSKLKELDEWLRNRLRYCICHHWKQPERKRKNLIRLGVEQKMAYQWSHSRMGGWAIAQSPILGTTITLERLYKRGYLSLFTHYEKVAPYLNEPLYPARGGTYSGAGSSPCQLSLAGQLTRLPAGQFNLICFNSFPFYKKDTD